jgi:hypothetical protein
VRIRLGEWAAVAIAFALIAATVGVWLAVDRRPPEWDHANHLERAILCIRDLARGDVEAVFLRSSFYPPLVLCAGGLAWRLTPTDVASPQAVIVAFLGLGMAATYLLGRRFAGGLAGVVAALVFGTAPFVVWQALRFQIDLPLAAMVAVALEALLRTDRFRHRGWSIAAGVVFGLGMLTKPPFAVYLLPPLVLALWSTRGGRASTNAAAFGALAVLVSLPWYGPRLLGLGQQIGNRSFKQAAEAGHPEPFTAAGLLYYPMSFGVQIGAVGAVLFIVGLALALRRRLWMPLAALAPLVVFFVIQNKNLRYTQPLIPVAAALAGVGAAALGRHGGVLALALVVVAGGVQVASATFGVPRADRLMLLGLPMAVESPPVRDDWRHREVLAAIARDSGGREVTVSIVPNHAFYSIANFRYYGVRDGMGIEFDRAWDTDPIGVEYMVLKTGDLGPEFTAEKPRRIDRRLAEDRFLARIYPVIGQWALPDGSTSTLRARRIPADLDVPAERVARDIESAFAGRLPEIARDVEGLRVRLEYDREILVGRIRRAELSLASGTVGELRRRGSATVRVRDLVIVLDDVLVNPFAAHEVRRLDALDIGRVRLVHARIDEPDFQAFLAGLKGLREASVRLEDGAFRFRMPLRGPDVSAHVRLVPSPERPFAMLSDGVRLGWVPVPDLLVDWVMRAFDPSLKLAARAPMPVEIAPLSVSPAGVVIGAGGR